MKKKKFEEIVGNCGELCIFAADFLKKKEKSDEIHR